MKYTSKEKQDLEKMKQGVNKNGLSDKAKKYIGSALLAAQIMGAGSALASVPKINEYDLQNKGTTHQTEMGQIFNEVNIQSMIESLDFEEVKRRLNQVDSEIFSLEKLTLFEKDSNGYLRNVLLKHELDTIELLEENQLKERIAKMPISDIKKKLIKDFGYYEESFEEWDVEELRESLLTNESLEKYNIPKKRVPISIKKYEEYLEKSNYSDEIKKTMLSNLKGNLKSLEISYLPRGLKGAYFPDDQEIRIRNFGDDTKFDVLDENDVRDIFVHEMTHAATMSTVQKDLDDMCEHGKSEYGTSAESKRRCGVSYKNDSKTDATDIDFYGVALNEGMTEYFSNKLLEQNGHKSFVMYPMFVSVVKDLVNLYGEEEVLNAFVKSPERLEELMAKDGHCFTHFMELLDDSYKGIYISEKLSDNMKSKSVQKTWNRVGSVLEDIKEKRLKENPGLVLSESNWKKAVEFTEKVESQYEDYIAEKYGDKKLSESKLISQNKFDRVDDKEEILDNQSTVLAAQTLPVVPKKQNRVVAWFKNIKEKIANKFKKEEKPLLLNSGEEVNSLAQKRSEFLEGIKVDKDDLITQNQSQLGNEKAKALEKEDDEMII